MGVATDHSQHGNATRHQRRWLPAILIVGLLAGCALLRPTGSWVELTQDADAEPEAIVVFVTEATSNPGANVALAPVPEDQAANRLTFRVREKLLARGFRISEATPADGGQLSYMVSLYGGQTLLRISLRQTEVSVLFARDSGGTLRASAPLAQREKAKVL